MNVPHFFTNDAAVILYARTELAIVAARVRNLLPNSYRAAANETPIHTRTLEALAERLALAADSLLAYETRQRICPRCACVTNGSPTHACEVNP
jgi:hypothetical protein